MSMQVRSFLETLGAQCALIVLVWLVRSGNGFLEEAGFRKTSGSGIGVLCFFLAASAYIWIRFLL